MFLDELAKEVGDSKFAIIDIGGYFSHVLAQLYLKFGSKLIGVVEDTENGHQKYENAHKELKGENFPFPVISVARSPLKKPEDFLVGKSIANAADNLLKELDQSLEQRKILVFGYGKIGASIAHHLIAKKAHVFVYDKNPMRQLLALSHGFLFSNRADMLYSADAVFCATGNFSLKKADFKKLKKGCYIFTATSIDDEIADFEVLFSNSTPHCHNNKINCIKIEDTDFFLCNKGHPANFMYAPSIGAYINLVQAELILALSYLFGISRNGVQLLSDSERAFIASLWLETFHPCA